MKKIYRIILVAGVFAVATIACTNLDENVYSSLMSGNYYQKRSDVVKAVFRPFEHFFEAVHRYVPMEEYPADVMITPQMDGQHYGDNGVWSDWHTHSWQDISGPLVDGGTSDRCVSTVWSTAYTGIGQCNLVLDDIKRLDHKKFPDITEDEWNSFEAQLRTERAYAYWWLLNFYRNCQLITSSSSEENEKLERKKQVSPQTLYEFIETELLECINLLPAKQGNGGPGIYQGQFTKAAAATILVRLYLNSEAWVGLPAWDKCRAMCDRILGGEFGNYALSENWYGPFDWNNEECPEVIYGMPASYGTSSWHMQNDRRTVYGRSLPVGVDSYLEITPGGGINPKWHLSPSFDNQKPRKSFDQAPYSYKLGCPMQKFRKYSEEGANSNDLRLRQYKNLSANTREGMFFLEGPVIDKEGNYAKSWGSYDLHLLDQVGGFEDGAPTGDIRNASRAESTLMNGDMNSGLVVVKYPYYPFNGGYYLEPDYTDMRLAEIVYSKAECLYRAGDVSGAGALLNSVRKRNYRNFTSNIAYVGSDGGTVVLDDQEFIDEWMREFIFEGRRRTDLIRWDRFEEAWWDKPVDSDKHKRIYPLSKSILELNPYLVQNPGYPGI
ncbi:MAG: RagB/SusD family nutrient uptake outer membrane protein [Bacteroidales bacterium]|nr:RagB/SusD family nutrient uptake outer membrane protein [Bacteroidales bacterium]